MLHGMESTGYPRCQLQWPSGQGTKKEERKREKKKKQRSLSASPKEDPWARTERVRHTKKNTEANTKVYDLNQNTMQALDRLAGVHATFEEQDILCADACGAMDEFAKAQQHQARCQDEVKGCRENLDAVVRDLNNFRALLDAAC